MSAPFAVAVTPTAAGSVGIRGGATTLITVARPAAGPIALRPITVTLTAGGVIGLLGAAPLAISVKLKPAPVFSFGGVTYPNSVVTPYGSYTMLERIEPLITYTSFDGTKRFHIRGGLAPTGVRLPNYGGVAMQSIQGLAPPFKHLDQQGARQDGTTWNDTVYDAAEYDMTLTAVAADAAELSETVRDWIAAWDPKKPGLFEYFTYEMGCWWCDTRLFKTWTDQLKRSPRRQRKMTFAHAARNDNAFWRSADSVSTFAPGGTGGAGFIPLTNIGSEDGWARHLCYAGTSNGAVFSFGNGPGNTTTITFGPLLAGQIVLITTMPRLRSIVDLTPNLPPQSLSQIQAFIDMLLKLITANQVPPLLQWFESLFGILPPQGPLYSLLRGRFSKPIPGVAQPSEATTSYTAVKITGGNSASKVISALTPLRRWPE